MVVGTGKAQGESGTVRSEQDDRDAGISAAQVRVALQFSLGLQQAPGLLIRFRPVLSKDAGANLAGFNQFAQTFLHRDADIATDAGRAVSVNQFEQLRVLSAGDGQFAVETHQGLVDLRHAGLEFDGFDERYSESLAITVGAEGL